MLDGVHQYDHTGDQYDSHTGKGGHQYDSCFFSHVAETSMTAAATSMIASGIVGCWGSGAHVYTYIRSYIYSYVCMYTYIYL